MSAQKDIDYSYYIFWSLMVFLGSLVGIFVLSNLIPKSLIYAPNRDIIEEARKETQDTNSTLADDIADALQSTGIIDAIQESANTRANTNNTPLDTSSASAASSILVPRSDVNKLKLPLGTNAPFFIDGNITPTGQFTNYRGTVFVAGILTYTGQFPDDFEQESQNQIPVTIDLAFGWRDLPNFDEIATHNSKAERIQLQLGALSILDLKIQPQSSTQAVTREIELQLSEYFHSIFRRQLIPSKIHHLAQQRLAVAYIAKNHLKIELIPK